MRVGVDTGGTFTDLVGEDGLVAKVLSTPDDPSAAVAATLPDDVSFLAHGTTVATNALLERRGANVALVTTEGFGDVIEIARQDRPSLYDPWADRPEPLVPRGRRLEVAGRLDATGAELAALGPVPAVPDGVEAVAVVLLHADLSPAHEKAVADELRRRGHDVSASHEVSPEFREYERTVTTAVNAYLRPVCRRYLPRLAGLAGEVTILTSAGGLVPLETGAGLPVSLLLSGPAAGVRAAAAVAAAAGFPDAVSLDMGGTSTDVCLIRGGVPEPAAVRTIAGLPVRMPAFDVHTIGAGGGSIAVVDAGGALVVGPRSAGARPGPACYGLGGTDATVTDADLVAERLPADLALPGLGRVSVPAAHRALAAAGVTAEGVIDVVDAAMIQAVRAVTVERGVDPRQLALVAFGGAGPLHACAIAAALGMPAVVVPPRAGVLSAVGLLGAPRQIDLVRSWPVPQDHTGVAAAVAALAHEARAQLGGGEVETWLDCRYAGQSHELRVPTIAEFGAEHRRRNGYERPGTAVEVVALRARASLPSPAGVLPPPSAERRPCRGPRIVAEPDCTLWVGDGWRAEVADDGSWIIRRGT